MLGWLTCDFQRVYAVSFLDIFMNYGDKTKMYSKCLAKHNQSGSPLQAQAECTQELQDICLKSKVVLIKTIRTSMKMVLSAMEELDSIKVIHLVRDPRPVVLSQLKYSCTEGVTECAKDHCQKVVEDSKKKDRTVKYRNNIKTVTYENISIKPVDTVKNLYMFINMTFSGDTRSFVKNITQGGNKRNCKICEENWQFGKNTESSEQHVNAWRTSVSKGLIERIERLCKPVIDMYGYS